MSATEDAARLAANLELALERQWPGVERAERVRLLCELTGYSRVKIRNYLAGTILPCPREVRLLAVLLCTTPDALYADPPDVAA